jgi:hypothetical protein
VTVFALPVARIGIPGDMWLPYLRAAGILCAHAGGRTELAVPASSKGRHRRDT